MTTNPPADLQTLAREWGEALAAAGDEEAVEEWRRSVLGRSGALTGVLRGLSSLPPEERRATGQAANVLKRDLEAGAGGAPGGAARGGARLTPHRGRRRCDAARADAAGAAGCTP